MHSEADLLAILENEATSLEERQAAGDALGRLGDERATRVDLVRVPPGTLRRLRGEAATENDGSPLEVKVAGFSIARKPPRHRATSHKARSVTGGRRFGWSLTRRKPFGEASRLHREPEQGDLRAGRGRNPLPRPLRRLALGIVPQSYLEAAQARRGSFIFLKASRPI